MNRVVLASLLEKGNISRGCCARSGLRTVKFCALQESGIGRFRCLLQLATTCGLFRGNFYLLFAIKKLLLQI